MVDTYFNFELLYFCLSIHLFLFVHNYCERTDGPIGMKFGMSTWSGYGMLLHNQILNCYSFCVSVYHFSIFA